jgi:hypothetical protein
MRLIPDQLRSKNLIPFKKRHGWYKIPGVTTENHVMDRVDADLSAEEQSYVRHYLSYADALIKGAEKNAEPEPGEAPETAGAAQVPREGPDAGPANEDNPATKDHPVRAA